MSVTLTTLAPTDTLGYLQQLFEAGDWINLKLIHQTQKWVDDRGTQRPSTNDAFGKVEDFLSPEVLTRIAQRQDEGWNVYVGMNAFTPDVRSRRKKDVRNIRSIYIEFDENGDEGLLKISFDASDGLIPKPHFVLQSSLGKYYVIWLVEGFTLDQQEALNSALQKRYGSDPASVDAARVLRLPGTRNLKPQYSPTPVVTMIEQNPHERYTSNDFKIAVNVREEKPSVAIESEKLNGIAELVLKNLDEAGVKHGGLVPHDNGYKIVLDECLWGSGHQNGDPSGAAVFIAENGALGHLCFHTYCAENRHWKEFREELEKRVGHKLSFDDSSHEILVRGVPLEVRAQEAQQKQATPVEVIKAKPTSIVLVFETKEDAELATGMGFKATHVDEPIAGLQKTITVGRNGFIQLPNNKTAKPRTLKGGYKLYPHFATFTETQKVIGTEPLKEWLTKMLGTEAVTNHLSRRAKETPQSQNEEAEQIPAFDPTVMNGIYKEWVEALTVGTTLAPQFLFGAIKTIVGLRMAGKVKFQDLDAEPRYYFAAIGETGSGKGAAWKRSKEVLKTGWQDAAIQIKLFDSADSGAGIRDLFFDPPINAPALCYIDEVKSLSDKSKETKSPDILNTMVELADSTSISRTKAGSQKMRKSKDDARLGVYMCGQDGDVYANAFSSVADQGFFDRLYPEFGTAQVVDESLPPVDPQVAGDLIRKLNSLDYSGTMVMSAEAKAHLSQFWRSQDGKTRTKARWHKNLMLDAYLSAFGRGSKEVTIEDAEIATRICTRQLIIRRVCFRKRFSNVVGQYIAKLKELTETMSQQLVRGADPEAVAMSKRDFTTKTKAYAKNELTEFNRAWDAWVKDYLREVTIMGGDGHKYRKFLPVEE